MAFTYATPPTQAVQTPTFGSKSMLVKSFKIDVAAGSGLTSGTTYTLGSLPKGAQIVFAHLLVPTAVSGGTVSAATLVIQSGGYTLFNGTNVFAATVASMASTNYYANLSTVVSGGDQLVTVTPTLTGAGATAGIIYINLLYVV